MDKKYYYIKTDKKDKDTLVRCVDNNYLNILNEVNNHNNWGNQYTPVPSRNLTKKQMAGAQEILVPQYHIQYSISIDNTHYACTDKNDQIELAKNLFIRSLTNKQIILITELVVQRQDKPCIYTVEQRPITEAEV